MKRAWIFCIVFVASAASAGAMAPGEIALGGEVILRLRVPAGGYTLQQREDLIQQRLIGILSLEDLTADDVTVQPTRYGPTITVRGKMLLTVDVPTAAAAGSTPEQLAPVWARRLGQVLPRVNVRLRGEDPVLNPPPMSQTKGAKMTTASGLQFEEIVEGTGVSPKVGQRVTVHYVGTLTNGTKFDASRDRNQPFTFTIGQGQVIKGWDEGVLSMKVGGKRNLTIPPDLGYGARGAGGVIPPNATLLFEVELLGVE